jgi:hypothetical protein
LKLDAHERKKVKIMFEYAGDTSGGPPLSGPESEEYPKKHNNVGLAAFIEDPRDKPSHAVEALGGAQIQVATGRSTEFEEFNVDEDGFRGTIVTSDDHKRVRNGKVILVITLKEGEREYVTVQLSEGKFSRAPTREWQSIRAYYIPTTAGYADSESKRIYNDNAFK